MHRCTPLSHFVKKLRSWLRCNSCLCWGDWISASRLSFAAKGWWVLSTRLFTGSRRQPQNKCCRGSALQCLPPFLELCFHFWQFSFVMGEWCPGGWFCCNLMVAHSSAVVLETIWGQLPGKVWLNYLNWILHSTFTISFFFFFFSPSCACTSCCFFFNWWI